jgi:Tfp pilus assembly protein PilX
MSKNRKIRGVAIPLVLLVIMLVTVIGFAISTVGVQNTQLINKNTFNQRAYYAAEAGLDRAIAKIQASPDWNGYEGPTPSPTQSLTYDNANVNPAERIGDHYSVKVYNNIFGATPIPGEENLTLPTNSALIMSVGVTGKNSIKKIGAIVGKRSLFDYGLYGRMYTNIGNINLWGYDSSLTPVPPANVVTVANQGNAGSNGEGWAGGAIITTAGNPAIHGGVYLNDEIPLNPTTVNVTTSGVDNGIHSTAPMPMPTITPPALPVGAPVGNTYSPGYSYGDVNVGNNNDITLNGGGMYIFNELRVSANSNIIIKNATAANPVMIFLTGSITGGGNASLGFVHLDAAGNPITGPPTPGKLQIYGTSSCTEATFHGNPQGEFCFYGPQADARICGNVDVYGSIVGKTIDESGHAANLYYDIRLRDLINSYSPVVVRCKLRF